MADDVARLVATLEADISKFTKGLDQAQKIADQRFGQIEKRMKTTEGLFVSSPVFGSGAAKFFSSAALVAFGKNVLETVSALGEQAQQIGVSVEAFQAYRAILKDNGADAAQASQAIAHLTDTLGRAKDGNNDAIKSFERLGLGLDDINNSSPEAALAAVAKGALQIGDVSQRNAALVQIFGERIARFLVPALADLARGADDNIASQKALGRVLSEDTVNAADKAHDALGAVWDKLVNGAAPAVTAVAGAMDKILEQADKTGHALALLLQFGAPQIRPGANGPDQFGTLTPEQQQRIFNPLGGGFAANGAIVQNPSPGPQPVTITPGAVIPGEGRFGDELGRQAKDFSNSNLANAIQEDIERRKAIQDYLNSTSSALDGNELKPEDLQKQIQQFAELQRIAGDRRDTEQEVFDSLQEQVKLAGLSREEQEKELATLQAKRELGRDLNDSEKARLDDLVSQRQAAEQFSETTEKMKQDFASFVSDSVTTGKVSFGNLFRALEADFANTIGKDLANLVFGGGGNGGGGGGLFGSILGGIGSLLGFAGGGDPPVGVPSIVGERGPELFVPRVAGTIIPNSALGASQPIQIVLTLSDDLNARMVSTSTKAAVQVVTKYDRGLPRRVNQIASDPLKVR
jgi:hypothetical protein